MLKFTNSSTRQVVFLMLERLISITANDRPGGRSLVTHDTGGYVAEESPSELAERVRAEQKNQRGDLEKLLADMNDGLARSLGDHR